MTQTKSKTPATLRILIDPGHGGRDAGASCGGIREADINLKIAGRLWAMLEDAGHHCQMTRSGDTQITPPKRVAMEHMGRYDLLLSLHANAATPEGSGMAVQTYPGRVSGKNVAACIRNALKTAFGNVAPAGEAKFTPHPNPDNDSRFYLLAYALAPAVLVELGSMANDADRAFLTNPENQTDIAAVISQGIEEWRR